jgi:hypothetical protein
LVVAPSFSLGAASDLAGSTPHSGLASFACPRMASSIATRHLHLAPVLMDRHLVGVPALLAEAWADSLVIPERADHDLVLWKSFVKAL